MQSPLRGAPRSLALLALLLPFWGLVGAYTGFDCATGSALLLLTSHSECGAGVQVACFNTVAMRVRQCGIKAWPHRQHKHHRPHCVGIQMQAEVTNVNVAAGNISGPIAGGARPTSMPVVMEFSRPDESMYMRYGRCLMRFDVQAASDASLHPVPGEDEGAVSSLLVLLLPAILIPCMCVGLIIAVGSITTACMQGPSPGTDRGSTAEQLTYSPLPGAPPVLCASTSGDSELGQRQRSGCKAAGAHGHMGLFTRTFNLKAMSRRAIAKRLRRSTRPVFIGVPQDSAEQQYMYAAGRLQPGGARLGVAPCFRFPPVAVAPGLEAIPEVATPSSGPSAAPSRSSSCQDMPCMAESPTHSSTAAAQDLRASFGQGQWAAAAAACGPNHATCSAQQL